MPSECKPVSFDALVEAHRATIRKHGGLPGIKDENVLRGAIDRPVNISHYEDDASPGRLAAAVCYGVVKNHGFNDGNTRAGLFALSMQLRILGYSLDSSNAEAVRVIRAIADGTMSEEDLAHWVDRHLLPLKYR